MKTWLSGICAALMLPMLGASAEQPSRMYLSGDDFLAACTTDDPAWVGFCNGYVQGVYDSLGVSEQTLCVPAGTTRAEIAAVVVKQLTDTPDREGLRAAAIIHTTLLNAFPCS